MEDPQSNLASLFKEIGSERASWLTQCDKTQGVVWDSFPGRMVSRVVGDMNMRELRLCPQIPSSPANKAIYFDTWREPACALRLASGFPNVIHEAVGNGAVRLGIKTHFYSQYPVIQIVLWIDPPGYPPYQNETLCDIRDAQVQQFTLGLLEHKAWQIIIGYHDDNYERTEEVPPEMKRRVVQARGPYTGIRRGVRTCGASRNDNSAK